MEEARLIDVKENDILRLSQDLLAILLQDKTTNKNLIWATNDYISHGIGYSAEDEITIYKITGRNGKVIRPRANKSQQEQKNRVKNKAEVFTPSWICNKQNNLIDNSWFGREDVFNKEIDKTWITNSEKIVFPKDKVWQDYIKGNRLEITCGEAPYLVSRYDTVNGEYIEVKDRIGLLDRKLRIVSENVDDEKEWYEWSKKALKSIYGFEWQGDNVLLARENILYTFIDYYKEKFGVYPKEEYLKETAEIITWNIWQMDGLKFVIPNSCKNGKIKEETLFGEIEKVEVCEGCEKKDPRKHNGIYCYIMNWNLERKIKFVSLLNKKGKYV